MEWRPPWVPVPNDQTALNLESELTKEATSKHPLYGLQVSAIGFGEDPDDVIFELLDGKHRFAIVHLTWRMRPETPPWPHTVIFADERDLVIRGIRPSQQTL